MSGAILALTGRCARDAEPINSSIPGARLSIPSSYYKKGEELTMWWKVTVWGKEAEFCLRNVRKGDVVMVSGEPYEYVFSKDGQEVRQNCIDAKVFKKIASGTPRNQGGGQGGGGQGGWGNQNGGNRGGNGNNGGWGNQNGGRHNQGAVQDDDPVPF